ncbi:hypothetical protein FMK80_06815 [Klebsiella oxytoca]|nr:hypothetical protein [Klebsiella oxytoca]
MKTGACERRFFYAPTRPSRGCKPLVVRIFCEQISCTFVIRCNALNTLRGATQSAIFPFV